MHKPKLVIFDMDGLMFDTEKMGSRCHIQAAKEFGYTISEEFNWRKHDPQHQYIKRSLG